MARSRKAAGKLARTIEKGDREAVLAVEPLRHTPAMRVLGPLSELADQPPLIAGSAAVIGAGVTSLNPRLARAGLRMLASHLLATWMKSRVKAVVDRTRPKLLVDEGRYAFEPGGHAHDHDLTSFPSGHTAGAVAVARALSREYPGSTVPGLAATAVVAAVQVPRCAHYPSDLAAGAAIGMAAEWLVDRAFARLPPIVDDREPR